MNNLTIQAVENGFIAHENTSMGNYGKSWAFESATTLAAFIKKWGIDTEKLRKK